MPDTRYLKQRRGDRRSGARWYVRVAVPLDLQEALGTRIIERSLDTSDFNVAKTRRYGELTKIFESFERARGRRITSSDIEHEAQRHSRERLEQLQKAPGNTFEMATDALGNDIGLYGEMALAILREEFEQEDWSGSVIQEADRIAKQYGVTPTQTHSEELCRALQLAEIEALSRVLSIHNGTVPDPITVLNARAVDPITAVVRERPLLAPKQGKAMRVSEAADAYFADRNRQRRSALTGQTTNQSRATLRMLSEFTRDAPLDAIKRTDVAAFLSALANMNPSYGKRSSAKKMKFDELRKKYPAPAGRGLGDKTLNRHAAVIAGLFDWAITTGKFDGTNPAKGHHRSDGEHEADHEGARRPFSTDELAKLLGGALFTPSFVERAKPTRHTVETTLAWLIPIALYSGMRLDEICGLRTSDATEEEGVQYFDLRSHEGRRLKTAAARRRVPVHSELLQIGFETYLAHVRSQGHEYLFPALKPGGPDGKRSWYVSKRFTTYRRTVGVGTAGTVFHCFRKNAATALERARVPENEAVQILGHKKMTMSYGLYSGGLDLAGLARVVAALTYPGLDLSRLHKPKSKIGGRRAIAQAGAL